jgi:hypothetical protein
MTGWRRVASRLFQRRRSAFSIEHAPRTIVVSEKIDFQSPLLSRKSRVDSSKERALEQGPLAS